jgi:dynein heavy chain
MSEEIDPIGVVCSEAEIAVYQTQGLPSDRVSAENAAIVINSIRYPLLVDPQLQAVFWLKNREGSSLKIARLGQSDLIKRLLKSIEVAE